MRLPLHRGRLRQPLPEGIADLLYDRGMQILQAKEVRYGAPVMRELERICLLKCVDRMWMDHIDNMDQLRQGIALRGYGQKDPVWSTASRALICLTRWWIPSGSPASRCC